MFYWLTGFIVAYNLLKKLRENDGELPQHPIKTMCSRYLRFMPLYLFMILFLWKFIALLGGDGPRFYQYENGHGCKESWMYHLLMINNLFPWGKRDYCIEPSWYLANDFQFLLPCISLVQVYHRNRKTFYILLAVVTTLAMIIQIVQISGTHFSVSFFAQFNSYWTKFYSKPWTRIVPYLMGMQFGCSYYSFKYEDVVNGTKISRQVFEAVKTQNVMTLLSAGVGLFLMFMITCFCKMVSEAPPQGDSTSFAVGAYLVLSRPTYCFGFSLFIMPMLLQNKLMRPLSNFMSHSWFAPYARLTFGVFLCNSIFMQFNSFNSQNGMWAQKYETALEWCAYGTFSFVFSLFTYLLIEAPMANFMKEFVFAKPQP